MRKLQTLLLSLTMITLLASCGAENESGNSSGNSVTTSTTISGGGSNFSSYSALKSYYMNKSFADNLTDNTVIYHIGSYFGAAQATANFNFAFCFGNKNLFGDDSLCNGYGNSGNELLQIVNNGEYKVVKDRTSTSVNYDVASGVSNGNFDFSAKLFDDQDSIYKDMLNLNNIPVRDVIITQANVSFSNGANINADHVEYFFSDGSYRSFVLGSNIALLSNPIAVSEGSYSSSGNYANTNTTMIGKLNNIGELRVSNIQATVHRLMYDYNTNTYRAFPLRAL